VVAATRGRVHQAADNAAEDLVVSDAELESAESLLLSRQHGVQLRKRPDESE